jgi:hypothetical protein
MVTIVPLTDIASVVIGAILLLYIWKTRSKLKKWILRGSAKWTK